MVTVSGPGPLTEFLKYLFSVAVRVGVDVGSMQNKLFTDTVQLLPEMTKFAVNE